VGIRQALKVARYGGRSAGEKAASIALLYPGGQGKHDDQGTTSAETADVSERRLRVARQIGRHSPDM
jgi:hypothetical protein